MLASGSCLLTDVADRLHEPSKKINTVERLSKHLDKGIPAPVVHIDDSDVIKPGGYKFEALGIVRDGSESTATKSIYKKGYHVTEACVLTSGNHPVSIFSHIHSSKEKTINLQIQLPSMPRNRALPFSVRQLSSWTGDTMTIRCF